MSLLLSLVGDRHWPCLAETDETAASKPIDTLRNRAVRAISVHHLPCERAHKRWTFCSEQALNVSRTTHDAGNAECAKRRAHLPHAALARTWPEAGLSCSQAAVQRTPQPVMNGGQSERRAGKFCDD